MPTKEDSDMVTCILTLAKFCNREIARQIFNKGKFKGEVTYFFNYKEKVSIKHHSRKNTFEKVMKCIVLKSYF